jgi:fucose permease
VTEQAFERDAVTRAAYLMLGLWGFLLYAIGPALPSLRDDLGVSRAAVGLHTTFIAAGALGIGLVGHRVVGRLGRRRSFWAAAAGISVGALVLASGRELAVTLPGAFVLGVAGSLQVVLVQSTLADRHGSFGAAAIVEANAVATALGAAAPFVVALAILAGSDWRAVFYGAALFAIPAVAVVYRSVTFPPAPDLHHEEPAALPRRYWLHWCALLVFVAVEFCVAFWATDYLESERALSDSAAAASASLLLVGMTAGRLAGAWLAKRLPAERILFGALAVATTGFTVYWLVEAVPATLTGLTVAGLGIAVLYPLTLALAIAASDGRTDAASARAAFATGIAVGVAPFALGALADEAGLRAANGIVPALLAAGFAALILARKT